MQDPQLGGRLGTFLRSLKKVVPFLVTGWKWTSAISCERQPFAFLPANIEWFRLLKRERVNAAYASSMLLLMQANQFIYQPSSLHPPRAHSLHKDTQRFNMQLWTRTEYQLWIQNLGPEATTSTYLTTRPCCMPHLLHRGNSSNWMITLFSGVSQQTEYLATYNTCGSKCELFSCSGVIKKQMGDETTTKRMEKRKRKPPSLAILSRVPPAG